jgi:hypothetical protein
LATSVAETEPTASSINMRKRENAKEKAKKRMSEKRRKQP